MNTKKQSKITILDKDLYKQATEAIKEKYPKHSAYRSGLIVKMYKTLGGRYSGDRNSSKLKRWFQEQWTNEIGRVGYEPGHTLYRPNIKVSKETPTTWQELNAEDIQQAKEQKQKMGRVRRFKKDTI